MEDHVVTMGDLPVMPDRVGILEQNLRAAEQRIKWSMALLWVLFIVVVLGAAGLISWGLWADRGQRNDLSEQVSILNKRMSDLEQRIDAANADRVKPIESRIDVLLQQLGSLQSDVGAIKARQEMQQNYYPYQPSK